MIPLTHRAQDVPRWLPFPGEDPLGVGLVASAVVMATWYDWLGVAGIAIVTLRFAIAQMIHGPLSRPVTWALDIATVISVVMITAVIARWAWR